MAIYANLCHVFFWFLPDFLYPRLLPLDAVPDVALQAVANPTCGIGVARRSNESTGPTVAPCGALAKGGKQPQLEAICRALTWQNAEAPTQRTKEWLGDNGEVRKMFDSQICHHTSSNLQLILADSVFEAVQSRLLWFQARGQWTAWSPVSRPKQEMNQRPLNRNIKSSNFTDR